MTVSRPHVRHQVLAIMPLQVLSSLRNTNVANVLTIQGCW